MIVNNINIDGLDHGDNFYFLNPIFLNISSETKFVNKVTLSFRNRSAKGADGNDLRTTEFRMQGTPEGVVSVDIAEYIKSVVIYPNGYKAHNPSETLPNSLNRITIYATVYTNEDSEPITFNLTKNFILGYSLTQYTNANFVDFNFVYNELTGEEMNIPYYTESKRNYNQIYTEYSATRYRLNNEDNVIESYIIDKDSRNLLNDVYYKGCDPIMFRFLNSCGGYSYVLFNSYTYSSQNEIQGNKVKVNNYNAFSISYINQRVTHNKEYTAKQEFDSRFRLFVDEFIRSQYVSVMFNYSENWLDVDIESNTMPNVEGDSFELSYKFKVLTSINQ